MSRVRYGKAKYRPLGSPLPAKMDRQDVICLHTMVGTLDGTDAYFRQGGYSGTESHFGVGGDGTVYQWTPLDRRADANLDGNSRVISIETADRGPEFPSWSGSDVPAWTDEQIDAIVRLVTWLCREYGIPPSLIPDTLPSRRGIGYHRQGIKGNWTDGSGWKRGEVWSTTTGKACPGDRRIRQLEEVVIPLVKKNLRVATTPNVDAIAKRIRRSRKKAKSKKRKQKWTKLLRSLRRLFRKAK